MLLVKDENQGLRASWFQIPTLLLFAPEWLLWRIKCGVADYPLTQSAVHSIQSARRRSTSPFVSTSVGTLVYVGKHSEAKYKHLVNVCRVNALSLLPTDEPLGTILVARKFK